jgi:Protein of unknown function (DUF3830)
MPRLIRISLTKRNVSCVARLLDKEAPRTCNAVWEALPKSGPVYHAKYARNEIYTLVPSFARPEPGRENPTITPIPGDVVYFGFEPWQLSAGSHGYGTAETPAGHAMTVDLAIFYERNNLLLNPDFGFVPGNVYGTIVEGLPEFAEASRDVWRAGGVGEVLAYERAG